MTNYYVKLTQEASEKLIATIGINALEINMAKGLIKVATLDDVRNVAEKYAVDNVNHQPYDKVMSEKPTTSDFKPVKEFSLKERKEIIGKTIDIGSIVMLDLEEGIVRPRCSNVRRQQQSRSRRVWHAYYPEYRL